MCICDNCKHCVVKLTFARRSPFIRPRFRQPWANYRFKYGKVRCNKGMWVKVNGEEKTYKDLYAYRTSKATGALRNFTICSEFETLS